MSMVVLEDLNSLVMGLQFLLHHIDFGFFSQGCSEEIIITIYVSADM
jgi:hypothetical protein